MEIETLEINTLIAVIENLKHSHMHTHIKAHTHVLTHTHIIDFDDNTHPRKYTLLRTDIGKNS